MAGYSNNKLGELRPNQLITTFGPGSVVDAVKDSVTVLDIQYWEDKGKKIIDRRFASYLNTDAFYMPRTTFADDIPVVTFPYRHVCSKCDSLFDARKVISDSTLKKYLQSGVSCPYCNKSAYPARFITICENGHMSDFPWEWWVHRGDADCKGRMKTYSIGETSTLSDIWVKCCSCNARRTMSGATQARNFEGLLCDGIHPFRPETGREHCKKSVIPSQRGASNVYFAVTRSAISIPPWINRLYDLIDEHLPEIEIAEAMGEQEDDKRRGLQLVYEKHFRDFTREEFEAAYEQRKKNIKKFTEIKRMEYEAIKHHNDSTYQSNKEHFKAEEDDLPTHFKRYFKRIIRVTRLREVRALLGFTRVDAPDPDADEQPDVVYLTKEGDEQWLPAVEVNGEGIFIEFNRQTLAAWLNKSEVREISGKYVASYKEYCESKGWAITTERNATYVLMHTFSHHLIKQMAMSSGYSSSAIRERIYFGDNMAGVLLYTGSSDKEGSLGGLVELGTADKMRGLLRDAFQEALICSNDPECMNMLPAGKNSNGATCHSCCMISETACENGNRMLDRGLVVPLSEREETSYFRELVNQLCQVQM